MIRKRTARPRAEWLFDHEQNWKLVVRDAWAGNPEELPILRGITSCPPSIGWVIRPGNGIHPTRNTEK
jgi:hypothetical protein